MEVSETALGYCGTIELLIGSLSYLIFVFLVLGARMCAVVSMVVDEACS